MLTFIDWFAGVGGFRKGMENAGHKCIGFCEFDKYAVASYTSMHLITEEQREYLSTLDMKKRQKEILKEEYRNGEWYAEDVRTVRADEIPRADCWCFGFPCQDISVAGKQLGFAGHRSSLFFAVTKLIRELEEESKPGWLFIENVKNLLSVNRGFDFAKLLVELDEIGYDCEWQLLNSKDFGVPQNRERVFIIGHLRGRSGREVFPVEGTDGENHSAVNQIGRSTVTQRDNPSAYRVYDTDAISPTLTNMAERIRSYYKNHRLKCGVDTRFQKGVRVSNGCRNGIWFPGCEKHWFKKGQKPASWVPVGTERIRKNGYIWVKIAEPKTWRMKQSVVWEAANGPVPKGHRLLFRDGNKLNCDLSNLMLLPDKARAVLNQSGLANVGEECIDTAIKLAEMKMAINNAKRRKQ